MPCIEMGGNFCLTQEQINSFGNSPIRYYGDFREWENVVFTHSGRSAITTAVLHMGLKGCEVFIPSFSCHSITDAFLSCDCRIRYYPVNCDGLTIAVAELFTLLEKHKPAILYTCPLFGFDTLSLLRERYRDIQRMGIVIMEDVTHSLLSGFASTSADVVVCSLRKWLEIPDGGFVWGLKNFDVEGFYQTHQEETDVVKNFINASKLKLEFLRTRNDELKEVFLPLFYKNNGIFGDASRRYRMSSFSLDILMHADFKRIIETRRANYNYLLDHINNPLVEIIFSSLPFDVVPLYMQVYVHKGQRDLLQQALIKERLFCPIIWHTPERVLEQYPLENVIFHDDMLSLVIDQRYDIQDMERLVQNINRFR